MTQKILTQLVQQFKDLHQGKAPQEIIVAPVALVALGLKQSVRPIWDSVPVVCREIDDGQPVAPGSGTRLGVFVYKGDVRTCDLP